METRGNRSAISIGGLMEAWEQEKPDALPFGNTDFETKMEEEILTPPSLVIKVLMSIGAWLGAVMLIAFLGLLDVFDSSESALFTGLVFILVYLAASFRKSSHAFLDPFILAIGMVGQVIVAGSLWDKEGIMTCAVTGIFIESALLIFINSSIQRFVSTILLLLCYLAIINQGNAFELTHLLVGASSAGLAYMCMNEPALLTKHKLWAKVLEPVSIGLAVGISLLLLLTVNRDYYNDFVAVPYLWLSTLMISACTLYVAWQLLVYYKAEHARFLTITALAVVLAPTVFAPGIAFSLLVLMLGFFRQQRVLLGWGIISLIVFVTFFYYNINISLLWKSIALMASGVALLATRKLIVGKEREDENTHISIDSTS